MWLHKRCTAILQRPYMWVLPHSKGDINSLQLPFEKTNSSELIVGQNTMNIPEAHNFKPYILRVTILPQIRPFKIRTLTPGHLQCTKWKYIWFIQWAHSSVTCESAKHTIKLNSYRSILKTLLSPNNFHRRADGNYHFIMCQK